MCSSEHPPVNQKLSSHLFSVPSSKEAACPLLQPGHRYAYFCKPFGNVIQLVQLLLNHPCMPDRERIILSLIDTPKYRFSRRLLNVLAFDL